MLWKETKILSHKKMYVYILFFLNRALPQKGSLYMIMIHNIALSFFRVTHYVRFSRFYWHFCKSINFSILYPKGTLNWLQKQESWCQKLRMTFLNSKLVRDHIPAIIHTWSMEHTYVLLKICPKMSVESWKPYIVVTYKPE